MKIMSNCFLMSTCFLVLLITQNCKLLWGMATTLKNQKDMENKVWKKNSLPYDKILDLSKFKVFADDNLNVYQNLKFALGRVENIAGKGENASYQHFLLFPQCFSNASYLRITLLHKERLIIEGFFSGFLHCFMYEQCLIRIYHITFLSHVI